MVKSKQQELECVARFLLLSILSNLIDDLIKLTSSLPW